MARGWESKTVAEQIEDHAGDRADAEKSAEIAVEDLARRQRLESLRMSRSRTLNQLERATNPNHRKLLERTLRSLEEEIENLTTS
jgi:hypothetical protein